ncbi:rRNA maturation RNase YbeY [Deefgea piscis]|uniref:Endoribonuclease YbeY n=1 Tax=Deefgea piscis TaxID=2739061 RepID=A0A6M8SRI6_9NEIS|nr:rRNA maturation RNase YbeY [Deefgea piscis]QKJ66718.1 rRNA maturation RNase YbeY [Deefgea piscis]
MKNQIQLAIQNESRNSPIPRKSLLRKWVNAALSKQIEHAEITLRFVDADEGQTLNRDYRQKDYATNVLTFTFDDELPQLAGQPLMGDLVLCGAVIEREAQQQGKALLAHYCHMVVHGTLHLQGFDHLEEAEAEAMELLETQIVTQLGYDDPYLTERE